MFAGKDRRQGSYPRGEALALPSSITIDWKGLPEEKCSSLLCPFIEKSFANVTQEKKEKNEVSNSFYSPFHFSPSCETWVGTITFFTVVIY
jgi:hypothetical protein